MAPMTSFRRHLTPKAQLRATSWMLMTGSSGMVASTLPVQWALPMLGWRGLFWALSGCLVLAMFAIGRWAPRDAPAPKAADDERKPTVARAESAPKAARRAGAVPGYAQVFRHRTFLRFLPLAFFNYGGLVALQALWIGPWLTRVCGWSPREAAQGLFLVNVCMLVAFFSWGVLVHRLYARGWTAYALIRRLLPLSLGALVLALVLGDRAGAIVWALFCVGSTVVTLAQPSVGQAFDTALAGRALSAFNLVIFVGVFSLQWAIGGVIDLLGALGWTTAAAFRGAFGVLAAGCALSYVWFLRFDDALPSLPVADPGN